MKSTLFLAALSAVLLTTSGCKKADSTSAGTTVNGTLMAGAISAAQVKVTDSTGYTVATGTSAADGTFSVTVPTTHLAEVLTFASFGGSYEDETAGTTVSLSDTEGIQLMVAASGLSDSSTDVALTPDSTLVALAAQDWATHHPETTALGDRLTAATAAFSANFGSDLDHSVRPVQATSDTAATSTAAQKKAAVRAMAFSDLATTLGNDPSTQISLLSAMGSDLADGSLDGMAGANAVPFGSGNLPADMMAKFGASYLSAYGSDRNKTGIKATELGYFPFAKVAHTSSYKVTYVPGAMAPMVGKTKFSLVITDLAGNPAVGVIPTLKPMMHMDGKNHTTPSVGCVAASNYQYNCTLYYLMPNAMKGVVMGYWSLGVSLPKGTGTETAMFYPTVKPSMTDTTKADLKAQTEQVMAMAGGTEARRYMLFKDSLTGMTGNHGFSVFLVTQASMKSFPAVVTGGTYNTGTAYSFTSTTVLMEASTDGSTWSTMTEKGSGVWSVSSLTGLTNGQAGKIYVRLTINGEQKTLDGAAASTTNGYATFTVTPTSM